MAEAAFVKDKPIVEHTKRPRQTGAFELVKAPKR
jgi:hypothetical protein